MNAEFEVQRIARLKAWMQRQQAQTYGRFGATGATLDTG